MATNEETFLNAAAHDKAFRQALRHKDKHALSDAFDRLGIHISAGEKDAVLDAVVAIDWTDLYAIEKRLSGVVHPDN